MRPALFACLLAVSASAEPSLPRAFQRAKAAVAPAPGAPAQKPPIVLRAMTYNVYGILPWSDDGPDEPPDEKALGRRYKEIAKRLRRLRAQGLAPHVVGVQEAWHSLSAAAAKEAGYPHVAAGASARLGKLAGAGLYIMSEHPILKASTVNYKECTGWDCVANKGAQHARILVPGLGPVDVYNTHMNADGKPAKPEDSQKARMAQIRDFAKFVRLTRDKANPAVFLGDFNFASGTADYALFERLLEPGNAAKDCVLSRDCEGQDPGPIWRDAIDHVFRLDGTGAALKAAYVGHALTEPWEGKPLSDHKALEARFSRP
jgi:endonuclease/exonuclease/phosphatase family metal-dependent hydrolase